MRGTTSREERRAAASAVLALALLGVARVAFADGPPRILGDGGAIPRPTPTPLSGDEKPEAETKPRPDVPAPAPPEIDERSILLDLPRLESLARPFGSGSLLNEVSLPVDEPGSVVTDYGGIEGVCVSKIGSYGRRLWRDEMKDRWSLTNMTIFEYEAAERRFAELQQDMLIGRWWERSWHASLVPEHGGAPAMARVQKVGEDLEVFHLGELTLTSAGRIRLGSLWLYVDDERIYDTLPERQEILSFQPLHARSDAQVGRTNGSQSDAREAELERQRERERARVQRQLDVARERAVDMSLGWIVEDDAARDLVRIRGSSASRYAAARLGVVRSIPRGNVYTGKSWNLTIRPTVVVKALTLTPETMLSNAQLDCRFRFYRRSNPGDAWAAIVVAAKADPGRRQAQLTASFELLSW